MIVKGVKVCKINSSRDNKYMFVKIGDPIGCSNIEFIVPYDLKDDIKSSVGEVIDIDVDFRFYGSGAKKEKLYVMTLNDIVR